MPPYQTLGRFANPLSAIQLQNLEIGLYPIELLQRPPTENKQTKSLRVFAPAFPVTAADSLLVMSFNDDHYSVSIEEWENDEVKSRAKVDFITWYIRTIPEILILGLCIAGFHWRLWIAIAVIAFPVAKLFTFLEEINENVRYVRHQMRMFREGVRSTTDDFARDLSPPQNISASDILRVLDGNWDYPK